MLTPGSAPNNLRIYADFRPLPKELYQQPGVLELQVKILSSRGDILEKSNKTTIRVIPKESAKNS